MGQRHKGQAGFGLLEEGRRLVREALREDVGQGDLTTQMIFDQGVPAEGLIIAGEDLLLAGSWLVSLVFAELDPTVEFTPLAQDGNVIKKGALIARLRGDGRALLTGERVAVNFLQRLSGIATLTARFVEKVSGYKAKILDTRKTTAGWRGLEKYAVRVGDGMNHRFGLYDGILIKDNHLALIDLSEAVRRAKGSVSPLLKVEVEVDSFEQAQMALEAGADIIMLDNMSCAEMRRVVKWNKGRVLLEASGGVTLETITEVAATGIDFISVGALTHSARAVDIRMDLVKKS
jgi:nicotinate-nucleotide pyrophosphorylase (carboxylating)